MHAFEIGTDAQYLTFGGVDGQASLGANSALQGLLQ